ncbi:hypothetical protein GCM10007298_45160 [Williamsia phyllosphaerae]|uniref:Uncharacterized protein n=2 Tax=Williamsia phyllosphaerae TaxID=885042 RepID=A0ABQ1V8N0_9NOCA|nr:hypothetical protein GCM10007298_45160 [Williamsia phyllosphaerae]
MTGVVTTYSDHENPKNPYFDIIPYVCPFLPDSLTRDKLKMTKKQTGFGGQHSLLQLCRMVTDTGPNYESLSITVAIQATSFADVSAIPDHTTIETKVPIRSDVTGTVYKTRNDDRTSTKYCNIVWGTFYGSASVTVGVSNGYRAEPCEKVREYAPLIAPYLPSKPIQMRPTEG